MNHYRHHLGDYAKDTMHLSPLQHGVYRLLIDAYYATERALPPDFEAACRIARSVTKQERDAVKVILSSFFKKSDAGWHHKRIDAEIAAYQAKAAVNKSVGKLGGRPRNGNPQETQTVSETKPNANPTETLASSHKPVTIKPEKQRTSADSTADATEARAFPSARDPRVQALQDLCESNELQAPSMALQQWVADGVTDEILRAAFDRGRQRKNGAPFNLGFLQLMVQDVRAAGVGYDAKAVIEATIAAINAKESNASH